jgi:hypothetical protein
MKPFYIILLSLCCMLATTSVTYAQDSDEQPTQDGRIENKAATAAVTSLVPAMPIVVCPTIAQQVVLLNPAQTPLVCANTNTVAPVALHAKQLVHYSRLYSKTKVKPVAKYGGRLLQFQGQVFSPPNKTC